MELIIKISQALTGPNNINKIRANSCPSSVFTRPTKMELIIKISQALTGPNNINKIRAEFLSVECFHETDKNGTDHKNFTGINRA
jgi:hypothetical protein